MAGKLITALTAASGGELAATSVLAGMAAAGTEARKFTITQLSTILGLSVASGKSLTVSNTLTLAGTDSSTLNIGAGGTLAASATTDTTNASNISSGSLSYSRFPTTGNVNFRADGYTVSAFGFDALNWYSGGGIWGSVGTIQGVASGLALNAVSLGAGNVSLIGEAANVLAIKNGVNAQEVKVYGNTTGSKYASVKHDGTDALINASSGAVKVGSTGGLTIIGQGYAVGSLPAGSVGARAWVSDALAPAFGVAAATGGAVTVPVFFDGTNWIVG